MRSLAIALVALVCVLAPGFDAQADSASKDRALVLQLKKQRLTQIEFKDTDLDGVIKWLRVATSKNILVNTVALAKAGVEWKDIRYTVSLEKVDVWTFMQDVLAKPHEMALKVKGNIVFFTSKADSYGRPVTKLYGISHITWTKTDFYGPEINLKPSGFTEDDRPTEVVVENDPLTTGDAVAELLKELLLPKLWEENDTWNIRATDRYLVIRAPLDVHARIPAALSKIASMK